MKIKKNKKGFTLVELVIVISVIAILIAVAVPTFSNVINSAKIAAAQQEASNLREGILVEYQGTFEDYCEKYVEAVRTEEDATEAKITDLSQPIIHEDMETSKTSEAKFEEYVKDVETETGITIRKEGSVWEILYTTTNGCSVKITATDIDAQK